MSETKHSLGPWVVRVGNMWRHDKPEEKCLCLAVASRSPQPGFEGAMVCSVAPAGYITEQDQANARLLAAAPELLEGLQDLFKMMDEGLLVRDTKNDSDSGWAIKQLRFVARLTKAQAAITKATQG